MVGNFFETGTGQLRRTHEDDSQRSHEARSLFHSMPQNIAEHLGRRLVGIDAVD